MQDRRTTDKPGDEIPAELRSRGIKQLEAEIGIIERWLRDLAETRDDNPETILYRKTYNTMLQSRKELLAALKQRQS